MTTENNDQEDNNTAATDPHSDRGLPQDTSPAVKIDATAQPATAPPQAFLDQLLPDATALIPTPAEADTDADATMRSIEAAISENPKLSGSALTVFSDLLLYHCGLGAGYISPFPETRGMVFSSAISMGAKSAMKLAERNFRENKEKELAPLREELEQLEAKAKEQKRGKSSPSVIDCVVGLAGDPLAAKIAALREKVRQVYYVTWREHFVHKNNLIDLLHRSAHGAMSYIDEEGSKLVADFTHPSRLAATFSLSSLTSDSADSALIRATGTGGINVMTLAGDRRVVFNYLCSPHPKVLVKLSEKISSTVTGSLVLGKAIVVTGGPAGNVGANSSGIGQTLERAMTDVYTRGLKPDGEKVRVEFENDQVKYAWDVFFNLTLRDYINREVRPDDLNSEEKMPATRQTIALYASRAVMTGAILSEIHRNGGKGIDTVVLTREHLTMAQLFAYCLLHQHFSDIWLQARQKNAAKARAALHTPQKLEAAYDAMTEALKDRDSISRSSAGRLKGVTLGLLDKLVAEGCFTELAGLHAGSRTRIYALPKNALLDIEEALADLEQAYELHASGMRLELSRNIDSIYNELQRKAERNKTIFNPACVPLTHMTTEEIRAIPALLEAFKDSTLLRGTESDPEPEALIVEDDEAEDLVKSGVPNLWFRYNPEGKPFYNWKMAGRLKMPESWHEEEAGS